MNSNKETHHLCLWQNIINNRTLSCKSSELSSLSSAIASCTRACRASWRTDLHLFSSHGSCLCRAKGSIAQHSVKVSLTGICLIVMHLRAALSLHVWTAETWFEIGLLTKCDSAFAHPSSDSACQASPGLGAQLSPAWVFRTGRGHEQKGNSLKERVLLSPEDAIGPLRRLLLFRLNLSAHRWEISLLHVQLWS